MSVFLLLLDCITRRVERERERERETKLVVGVLCRTRLGKVALAVADEEARLAAAAVAHDDDLLGVAGHVGHGGGRGFSAGGGGAHHGAHSAITRPRCPVLPALARVAPLHARVVLFVEAGLLLRLMAVVIRVVELIGRSHSEMKFVFLCLSTRAWDEGAGKKKGGKSPRRACSLSFLPPIGVGDGRW